MHSATSLQGSGLVRTVGPCAQARVASHRDAFSLQLERAVQSAACFESPLSRPPSLERSERRGGLFFVIPVNSLVDSIFERSENVTFAHFLVVSSSSS